MKMSPALVLLTLGLNCPVDLGVHSDSLRKLFYLNISHDIVWTEVNLCDHSNVSQSHLFQYILMNLLEIMQHFVLEWDVQFPRLIFPDALAKNTC